jgi:hypothetical protein
MRMRITATELDYYAKAKRDSAIVRVQGANWRVIGVTADRVPNPTKPPVLPNYPQGEQQQWWVELSEVK